MISVLFGWSRNRPHSYFVEWTLDYRQTYLDEIGPQVRLNKSAWFRLLVSFSSVVVGVTLIALANLQGPLGVPGYFTYVGCPNHPTPVFSCLYIYTLDLLAEVIGGVLILLGVAMIGLRLFRKIGS